MQEASKYDYMVRTKGMSSWDDIETFGGALESALNGEGNAHAELGRELWRVHVLSDSDMGNNGLVYVYRRPKL